MRRTRAGYPCAARFPSPAPRSGRRLSSRRSSRRARPPARRFAETRRGRTRARRRAARAVPARGRSSSRPRRAIRSQASRPLRARAEFRPHGRAQDFAGGNVGNAVPLRQTNRLSALAASRRADEDEVDRCHGERNIVFRPEWIYRVSEFSQRQPLSRSNRRTGEGEKSGEENSGVSGLANRASRGRTTCEIQKASGTVSWAVCFLDRASSRRRPQAGVWRAHNPESLPLSFLLFLFGSEDCAIETDGPDPANPAALDARFVRAHADVAMRMPNGALASLAGNVDAHHQVAIADLDPRAVQRSAHTVERLMRELQPDVVGLSVMTFQRRTARRIIALIRSLDPACRIVVGGYDPSLAPEAWTDPALGRRLHRARRRGAHVPRTAARDRDAAIRSPRSPACRTAMRRRRSHATRRARSRTLEDGDVRPAEPRARACWPATRCSDAQSTSSRRRAAARSTAASARSSRCAGATSTCFRFDRVHRRHRRRARAAARARSSSSTTTSRSTSTRFEALCRAIVDAGLHDIDYLVQAMTSSIAAHGETLAPLMRAAGFRYVFLGIENVLEDDLAFLKAKAKNSRRVGRTARQRHDGRDRRPAPARHARRRRAHRRQSRRHARRRSRPTSTFARRYVDWPYIQHPTPYPGTPMTHDFRDARPDRQPARGGYDGTTAVDAHART